MACSGDSTRDRNEGSDLMIVKVGIAVVIRRFFDNVPKVLVGRRKGSHGDGCWAFPGGHLDDDRSFEACAIREVLEETGMEIECVTALSPFGSDIFTHFGIVSKTKRYSITYLLARYVSNEAKNLEPNKCYGWEWKTLEEIKEMIVDQDWIPIDRLLYHRPDLCL